MRRGPRYQTVHHLDQSIQTIVRMLLRLGELSDGLDRIGNALLRSALSREQDFHKILQARLYANGPVDLGV